MWGGSCIIGESSLILTIDNYVAFILPSSSVKKCYSLQLGHYSVSVEAEAHLLAFSYISLQYINGFNANEFCLKTNFS